MVQLQQNGTNGCAEPFSLDHVILVYTLVVPHLVCNRNFTNSPVGSVMVWGFADICSFVAANQTPMWAILQDSAYH
jgi:hypothetical protein